MDEEILDLSGLKCPLPALFAARALKRAAAGSLLTVLADDPLAVLDIPHMCAQEGHAVVSSACAGVCARFVLRRGPSAPG